MEVMTKAPEGFSPQLETSACYLEVDHKFLFLQQAEHKSEPGNWGVPAGKTDKFETPEQAAIRELFEETSISLNSPTQIHYVGTLYLRNSRIDFLYHMFSVHLNKLPDVRISSEHQNYRWVSLHELKTLPLMAGAKEALDHYQALLANSPFHP